MIVFHPVTNKMLAELDVSADSFHYITLDGEDYLSLQVSTPTEIELPIGAYVNYNGVRYTLMQREAVRMVHTEQYDYTITLQSPTGYLSGYIVKLDTTHFSLTAQPRQHLQRIIDTLAMHGKQWSIGTCPDHQEITIEYKHIDCFSAIQEIARSLQWEYLLEHHTDGTSSISISPTIEYHRLDPLTLQYGYGKGLKSGIEVIPEEDGTPISTLYVTGTTRNIDASTYGSTALRLPRGVERTYQGSTYVTSLDGTSLSLKIAKGVYREEHFESTTPYPSREGHVSSVIAVDPSKFLFDFTDSSIPYTLDYSKHVLPKETMTVVFQTGSLAGVELEAKYTHQNRRFALVPKEQYGAWLPNADQLPKTGDRYAVYHISLPKEYIDQAEEDLLKEAIYHLHIRKDQQYTYRCEVDSSWASLNWESVAPRLTLGSCVTIGGLIKGTPSDPLRIIALKSYLHTPHAPEIELSNRSLPPERYPIPNFVLRNDNDDDLLSSIRDRLSWNLKLDERFIQKVTPNVTLNERYQLVVNDKIVSQKILKGADGKSVSVKDVVSAMQTNETVLDRVSKLLKSDAVFRQQIKGDTPKLSLNSQYQLVADDRIVSSVSLRGADAPPMRPNLLKLGNREGRFSFSNLDRGDGVAKDLFLLIENAPQDYEGLVVSFYRTIKEIVPRTYPAFMYIKSMLNNGNTRYLEAEYKVEDKGKRKKYELKFFHKVPKGGDVRLYYYENAVPGNETTVDVDFEELKVEALSAEDIETGRTGATAFIPHPDDLEGSGVESVEKEFALSSSKDSHPSSGWSATQPSWESGKYLWSRMKIVYKNPASTVYTGYSVSSEWEAINAIQIGGRNLIRRADEKRHYMYNNDGELQYLHVSTASIHAIAVTDGEKLTFQKTGAPGADNNWRYVYYDRDGGVVLRRTSTSNMMTDVVPLNATSLKVAYPNDVRVKIERGTKATDWTEAPEDVEARYQKLIANVDVEFALSDSMTVAPFDGWQTLAPASQSGKYMWQRTKTTLKDGSESIKGITCIQGADGRSIISVTEQYYHSTSMTALQGGSWSNTAPTPSDGKWIWTRSVIRFTVGDDTVTNAVCVTGAPGAPGEPGKSVSVDEVLTGIENDDDFGKRLADHVATLGGYVRSEDVDPKTTIVTIIRQGYKPMHVKLDSLTDADLGKRWEYAFRDRGTCVSTDGRVLVPPNCSIYDEGMHLIPSIGIDPDTGYNIVEAPIINACSNNRYSFYCIEFKGEMCYQFSNYGAIKIYDIGIQVNATDQKIASVNTILSNKATELEGHILRLNNQATSMSASIYRLEHASPTTPVGSIMYTSTLAGGGKINMTHDKTSGNTLYLPAAVEGEHLKIWCNIWVNRSFALGKSRSSDNLINTATGSDVSTLSLTKGHLYECIAINNETWIVTDLSR